MTQPARDSLPRSAGAGLRIIGSLLGLLLLSSLAACTGSPATEAAMTTPAGVTRGAAPVAPPSALPTWESDEGAAADADAGGSATEVVVTYQEWNGDSRVVEVGGYVSGTVEAGGRCSVELTLAGKKLTGSADAVADASTTACAAVRVEVPSGQDGDWAGVLHYESDELDATSAPFTVTVR
jgi:hypothetical protein